MPHTVFWHNRVGESGRQVLAPTAESPLAPAQAGLARGPVAR
jgi:hypothetical protein